MTVMYNRRARNSEHLITQVNGANAVIVIFMPEQSKPLIEKADNSCCFRAHPETKTAHHIYRSGLFNRPWKQFTPIRMHDYRMSGCPYDPDQRIRGEQFHIRLVPT